MENSLSVHVVIGNNMQMNVPRKKKNADTTAFGNYNFHFSIMTSSESIIFQFPVPDVYTWLRWASIKNTTG